MAQDELNEVTSDEGAKPKKGLKIMLIIIGAITLIQCLVLLVIFQEPVGQFFKSFQKEEEVEVLSLQYYDVGHLSVNLDEDHFLKTTVQLGYYNPDLTEQLVLSEAEVKAITLEVLRSKTLAEINTIEGTKQLQQELKEALNAGLESYVVIDEENEMEEPLIAKVLFVAFLYQ